MDIHFQDLQWVIDKSTKEFKRDPHRRISSLFRDLRKHAAYSFFGDYSLLWAIAESQRQVGLKPVREQFVTACQYSTEYKNIRRQEKMWWLNNFVNIPSGDLKTKSNGHSRGKKALDGKR
jgi:hypothetical protein